jgi:transcriptional regulator with XRE-family HTH domain
MITRRRAPQTAAGAALRHRFARNVRHFRTRKGMTQNQLAAAAGLGRTFISQVEQGRFSVTLETIGALSSALGICPTLLIQLPD